MSIPDTTPTRKQRFDAALSLAGQTTKAWCERQSVTPQHLARVLNGERTPGSELDTAIDETISRYLDANLAATNSAVSRGASVQPGDAQP